MTGERPSQQELPHRSAVVAEAKHVRLSANPTVHYTYNEGAAYSDDNGDTFHVMDANGLCSAYGKTLLGDQVVIFIPRINQFAWVILTTDQNIVLALASPREVQESGGTAWVTCL